MVNLAVPAEPLLAARRRPEGAAALSPLLAVQRRQGGATARSPRAPGGAAAAGRRGGASPAPRGAAAAGRHGGASPAPRGAAAAGRRGGAVLSCLSHRVRRNATPPTTSRSYRRGREKKLRKLRLGMVAGVQWTSHRRVQSPLNSRSCGRDGKDKSVFLASSSSH